MKRRAVSLRQLSFLFSQPSQIHSLSGGVNRFGKILCLRFNRVTDGQTD